MLSFDIRSLATRAVAIDGNLSPTDPVWEVGDARPADAVHVTGRLSSAGAERFYLSGRMEGDVEVQCRRCLTAVALPIREGVHLLFTEATDDEVDDPDVFRRPPRAAELDLRPAIREQWLLAVPSFAECRADCKGLCPRCGAELNAGPCECPTESDTRWAALRDLRSDAS